MALLVLTLLIGVPLIEIALFIQVGGWIGLWPTIATVILTALFGTALLRRQGLATLRRARTEMEAQRLPVRELFDGACLLAAGILLLTPGFLTDAVGFILLVPPLRSIVGMWAWRALQRHATVRVRTAGFGARGPGASGAGASGGSGPVIEGDSEDLSDAPRDDGSASRLPESDAGARDDSGSPWRRGPG